MKWLDNKLIQASLVRLTWVAIGLPVLILALLGASVFWVWNAFSAPAFIEEQTALVDYTHNSEFDYAVYVEPTHLLGLTTQETSEVEEEPLYYRNIIDNTDIEFTYQFIPDKPATDVSIEADIVALVTGPSDWEKEYLIKSSTEEGSTLTISFPLELDKFNEAINTIETELAVRESIVAENVYDLVIEARVNVKAYTGTEWIEDTFTQPMDIKVGISTLKWDNELTLSERKFHNGFTYKHQGDFSYIIQLKGNSLYNSETISSPEANQPLQIIRQPPGGVYFPKIIDIMKGNFSYDFDYPGSIDNLAEEVTITAVLEYPNMWSRTFTLLPTTQMSGDFTVDFTVDVNYFADMIDIIRGEIGMGAASHNLNIEARVHTTADIESGRIDEVFTHTLQGRLETTSITLSDQLTKSQPNSIMENITVSDPQVQAARVWSLVAFGVVILLCLYVLWNYLRAERMRPSPIDAEFLQASRKHKNVMVDVQELPEAEEDETVIPVSSLEGLFKTADGLLKPVLHKAEAKKHIYCVIDEFIRYEYISQY